MGRQKLGRATIAVLVAAGSATDAAAYTNTITSGGLHVRWEGTARLELAGNPINRSGLSERQVSDAVVRGLQRWKAIGQGRVDFDYWQGTSSDYDASSDYNGLSSLYFASNARQETRLGPNVLGLTQVWYNTSTGAILETDIVLNDRDFAFSTDPRDTSGAGSGQVGSTGRVFIENVLTHELGHAFGLSHSGTMQATMLFMESPEQAHLGCDELVAVSALYPAADRGARAAITGSVVDAQAKPVYGAHVLAISRERGTVLASALSGPGGDYQIEGLEPGTYYLMAEPFFAGAAALPSYYSGINTRVCSGSDEFARTFLTQGNGSDLRPISLSAGAVAAAPAIKVQCRDGSSAAVSSQLSASSPQTAPVIFDAATGGAGFGTSDSFSRGTTAYYRLKGVSGDLEVHAVGFSLYSRAHATLALTDADGSPVDAQIVDPVYEGDSGYINHDSSIVAHSLPRGDYVLRVSADNIPVGDYPAGQVMVDGAHFIAITGTLNRGALPLSGVMPENARCLISEKFSSYTPKSGPPPKRQTVEEAGQTGFCNSIRREDGGGGGSTRGPGAGAIAGWLAPWLFMLAVVRYLRFRAPRRACARS